MISSASLYGMVQKILRLISIFAAVSAIPAGAATLFNTSTFDSGLEGWAGGANPVVIAGDNPYLQASVQVGSLATFNTSGAWSGNFETAGISGLTVELRGPSTNSEPLAIRATLLGPDTRTRWVTAPVTVPADGIWRTASFTFDENLMTRIVGTASFAETFTSVERVLFRHDPGRPSQRGDTVTGTLDLDSIRSVPEPSSTLLIVLAGGAGVFRRRRRY